MSIKREKKAQNIHIKRKKMPQHKIRSRDNNQKIFLITFSNMVTRDKKVFKNFIKLNKHRIECNRNSQNNFKNI